MSNGGVYFPPDAVPIPDPITGRIVATVQCTICGKQWIQGKADPPPCAHTQAELDAVFNANPPGPEQRQRWKVIDPPVVVEPSPELTRPIVGAPTMRGIGFPPRQTLPVKK